MCRIQGRQMGPRTMASDGRRRVADMRGNGDCVLLHLCILRWLHELLFFKHRTFFNEGASLRGSEEQSWNLQ